MARATTSSSSGNMSSLISSVSTEGIFASKKSSTTQNGNSLSILLPGNLLQFGAKSDRFSSKSGVVSIDLELPDNVTSVAYIATFGLSIDGPISGCVSMSIAHGTQIDQVVVQPKSIVFEDNKQLSQRSHLLVRQVSGLLSRFKSGTKPAWQPMLPLVFVVTLAGQVASKGDAMIVDLDSFDLSLNSIV